MWLRKETGGTTIPWEGRPYHWPAADPVCEVPAGFGEVLLGIHGGGFTEVPAPPPPPKPAARAVPAKTDSPAPETK